MINSELGFNPSFPDVSEYSTVSVLSWDLAICLRSTINLLFLHFTKVCGKKTNSIKPKKNSFILSIKFLKHTK